MANDWLAVQNAYHLVQRNLVNNNNVDVMSGLPATSLSNPALDEETFKQALCVLEKANDALIKNQNSDMIAMSGWEISDPCLHSEFSKVVEKLFTDETHWGGILFYIALTTFLANKLISEGLYQFPVCWLLSLGTTRGGFRNLLLDGWWLEFWEIILLAAGDVERNPGPTFMTGKYNIGHCIYSLVPRHSEREDYFSSPLPLGTPGYKATHYYHRIFWPVIILMATNIKCHVVGVIIIINLPLTENELAVISNTPIGKYNKVKFHSDH